MRKFLIFIIILIPIIVTIALTATSRVISITTPDNPFGIEIRNSNNKIIGKDDIITIDINDLNSFIIVDVLPLMTKNSNINTPEIEEGSVGDVEIVRRGDTNRYSVIPKKVGPVKVVISAEANVNVKRAVIFNITSDSIESLVVFDEAGKELLSGSIIEIRSSGQLHLEITPIEALRGASVHWRVAEGKDVISISPNGYLTILSRGQAQIRAEAIDKTGDLTHVLLEMDTKNAIIKDKKIYVEEENVTPTYIREVFTLDPDPECTEVTIEENVQGDLIATVIHTDKDTGYVTEDTMLVMVAKANDWGFNEGPTLLYSNNTPYFLGVKDLLTGKKIEKGVIFTADPSKATIDKETGALFPLIPGELVVTARKGSEEKQIIFTVKERVPTFELELGLEDAKLGIQLTRKWGHFWLDENYELTNKHRFGLSNKNHTFDVKWNTSDSSVVSIEEIEDSKDIMLSFHEEGAGRSAVISATFMLYNKPVESIKRSFEFKLMDTPDYINITKFDELQYLTKDEEYNACLQDDIVANKQLNFHIGISFYGNGFLYDASQVPYIKRSSGAINIFREWWWWDIRELEIPPDKTLTDLSLTIKPIYFEEMKMRNAESMDGVGERGSAIALIGFHRDKAYFKHLQIYNTDRAIYIRFVRDAEVEGCILGDNGTCAVYAAYPELKETQAILGRDRASLTLRNNVFKNSSGPSVSITYEGWVLLDNLASGYMPDVYIEGFMDVYNWHTEESFTNVLVNTLLNALLEFSSPDQNLINMLDSMLFSAFYEYVTDKKLSHIYFTHNRKKYVSLGMFAPGMIFNPDISRINSFDTRLTSFTIPVLDENDEIFSEQIRGVATLLDLFLKGQIEVKYDSVLTCYDFTGDKVPAIKPGDPVPQTYELYARLTGNSADLYQE
ncbi:MAG TPA: hypothetical protein PKX91_02145 [Clostridia bacterium]|jgi:hypothetical protein|nr:hypothetical protein [Clostridia bacterium]